MKKVILIIAAMLFIVPTAQAHRGGAWITEIQAEDNIVLSHWGEKHNVDDAYCEGKQRPRYTTTGEALYQHFSCTLDVTVYLWNADRTCHTTITYHALLNPVSFAVTDYDEQGCDYGG